MQSFQAPNRILMGPGPSDVSERVLKALSQQTIGHMDPKFVTLMDEIKQLLQYAFQTENELTIPVSAPGSSGMETCFMNLVEPGDHVLICINGVFGMRMKEVASRSGADVQTIEFNWGEAVDPVAVDNYLNEHPEIGMLAFVHAETSTGVLSDAKTLSEIAHKHNCLVIVDAVTSLGGSELRVDDWNIDAIYSGTQKCLSCIPGLSPVSFSKNAVDKIKHRTHINYSWFLDLSLVMNYWGANEKRTYHHTAPVNSLYALHESLLILKEEGIETVWDRHIHNHKALAIGLDALGLELLVNEEIRLPQLNAVKIPDGINDAQIRTTLLNEFDLEIGAGLGKFSGNAWRIGLMGNGCNSKNVNYCIASLGTALKEQGYNCDTALALEKVEQFYENLQAA